MGTHFLFMKNTWIGDFSALYHIMNDNISQFNIDINKLIQGSSMLMSATKKGKLCINVWQVDRTEWVHILWTMKFCPKAGANLFSLTCELLQRKTILSDHQNNIVVKFTDVLDCQIKTHNGWVAGLQFLWETSDHGVQFALTLARKISTTSTLNLVIHPSQLPMSLLKTLVSKSLVFSNHMKIALWAKPNNG